MASRQGGGVGAFSWTLLGFLAGVAATLAVQMLLLGGDHGDDSDDDTPHSSSPVIVAPKLPAPTTTHHHLHSAAATSPDTVASAEIDQAIKQADSGAAPAKSKPKAQTPDNQVYDDAAAAGMTSRAAPSPDTQN